MNLKVLVLIFLTIFLINCSGSDKTEQNKKMAGDFLDLALSENPKSAQPLTHPDFTFTFTDNTFFQDINLPIYLNSSDTIEIYVDGLVINLLEY